MGSMREVRAVRFCGWMLFLLIAAACGSKDPESLGNPDAANGRALGDASANAGRSGAPPARPDAGSSDEPPSVPTDAATKPAIDAGMDAAVMDAAVDAEIDAGMDASLDATVETFMEAGDPSDVADTSMPSIDDDADVLDDDAEVDPRLNVCGTKVDIANYTGAGHEWIVDVSTVAPDTTTNPLGAALLESFIGTKTTTRFPWLKRPTGCTGSACYDQTAYISGFMASDTAHSVLVGVPYSLDSNGTDTGAFAVLSNTDALDVQGQVNAALGSGYALLTVEVMANDRITTQLAAMDRWPSYIVGWALSPGWSPASNGGYWLDDTVGKQVIEHGIALGKPIFFVHKGMPGSGYSPVYVNPRDIGPTAKAYPAARIIVQYAAFEYGLNSGETSAPDPGDPLHDGGWGPGVGNWPEGPYDASDADVQTKYPLDRGVNSLISSMLAEDIGPNENVYVSLDAVWAELITRPTEAAHVLGKLLRYVGEDNILWATQSTFYGNPQPQLTAFRGFEIPSELQTQYGYPALTPERKAKILGLNAARLFCLPPP
jgi:hypothetical protein